MIPKELLEILACPICKEPVELRENQLLCYRCRKAYPIRNQMPVMLVDEAGDIPQ